MKGIFSGALILSLVSTVFAGCIPDPILDMTFTLRGNNLEWPCESTKHLYKSSGRYIPRNVIATKMQIYNDEAIVALPRLKPGVPLTLGVVSLKKGSSGKIAPFPCWAIQEEGNCDALQSAVDIKLDLNGNLWVLDSGIVNALSQYPAVRRCPPKVVGFDVKSGKVIKVVHLDHLTTKASRLQSLSVDSAPGGKLYLYIADAAGRAIISYDVLANSGHRVGLPDDVNLGSSDRDVLYTDLVTRKGNVELLLSYLGSSRVFSMSASDLRKGVSKAAIATLGVKPSTIVILGTDNKDHVFFRVKGESDIYMWNTGTPFTTNNFYRAQKGDECRLPTQVVPGHMKAMWSLESNFQDFIQDTVPCSGASMSIQPLVRPCVQE